MTTSTPARRPDYFATKPELIGQLRAITQERQSFTIDRKIRALVETRISQINGCAYCTDLHHREARSYGEKQYRLDSLAVWRESPFFSASEKAALAWAETVTHASFGPDGDEVYARLQASFSDTEVVELSICAGLTNFWNRLATAFRKMPAEPAPDTVPCT